MTKYDYDLQIVKNNILLVLLLINRNKVLSQNQMQ